MHSNLRRNAHVRKTITVTLDISEFADKMKFFYDIENKDLFEASLQTVREILRHLPEGEKQELIEAIKSGDLGPLFKRFII